MNGTIASQVDLLLTNVHLRTLYPFSVDLLPLWCEFQTLLLWGSAQHTLFDKCFQKAKFNKNGWIVWSSFLFLIWNDNQNLYTLFKRLLVFSRIVDFQSFFFASSVNSSSFIQFHRFFHLEQQILCYNWHKINTSNLIEFFESNPNASKSISGGTRSGFRHKQIS